jgi:hypothetical protein
VKKGDEQRGADDRPHDRKRPAAHMEHERLGKVELMRNPPPASALPTAPQMAAMTIGTMSPGSVSVM